MAGTNKLKTNLKLALDYNITFFTPSINHLILHIFKLFLLKQTKLICLRLMPLLESIIFIKKMVYQINYSYY